MSRTTRRHLPPDKFGKARRRSIAPSTGRELSKPIKQTRAFERAALRKEHR